MKRIGLIGGLSPESTVEYYQYICRAYNERKGQLRFPEMIIRSVNLQDLVEFFETNDWENVAYLIAYAINDCQKAGAQFAAICANTPHNAYEAIASRCSLKVLSIMDATAEAVKKTGVTTVALLGTKPTMEYGFFQKTFDKHGISTIVPPEAQRAYINQNIWSELSHGRINEQDRNEYRDIIKELIAQGAEGIILGCTELPLLIKEKDSPVPLFNTTKIHAQAILDYAML